MGIQLIDWDKGGRKLHDKEEQWNYKLGMLIPHGLVTFLTIIWQGCCWPEIPASFLKLFLGDPH